MTDSQGAPRQAAESEPANRPPYETFKVPTCRGSYVLGTACGSCEKCAWERAKFAAKEVPASAVPEREGGLELSFTHDEQTGSVDFQQWSVPASGEREGEGTEPTAEQVYRLALVDDQTVKSIARDAAVRDCASVFALGDMQTRGFIRAVLAASARASSAPPVDAPAPSETEIVNRIVAGLSDMTLAKWACWGPKACTHPRSEHEEPVAALLRAALNFTSATERLFASSARVDAPADGEITTEEIARAVDSVPTERCICGHLRSHHETNGIGHGCAWLSATLTTQCKCMRFESSVPASASGATDAPAVDARSRGILVETGDRNNWNERMPR